MVDNVNNTFMLLTKDEEIADFIDGTNLLGHCIEQIINVFSLEQIFSFGEIFVPLPLHS